MNVIDFSEYKKTKTNLMNRVLEDTELGQGLSAAILEASLRASGFPRARVFFQSHNFVVVLDMSLIAFMYTQVSLFLSRKASLNNTFVSFLKERDPDFKEVVVFRRWPSRRQADKLLKKWSISY